MKKIISIVFITVVLLFSGSSNFLRAMSNSSQALEQAIAEKKITDEQKIFLRETPNVHFTQFKNLIFSTINELKNIYEYYSPEESQKLLFNAWLDFIYKNFDELGFKEVFSLDSPCEIPSEEIFFPILSEENFKKLDTEEKRKRLIQALYQARYVLATGDTPLRKIAYQTKKASDSEVFDIPVFKNYLKDLITLVKKEKLPSDVASSVVSTWLNFLDDNFEELNLKNIFPDDYMCQIPLDDFSYPTPSMEDFNKLDDEKKRKQIIQSLHQARHELEEYFTSNKKSLEKVAFMDGSKKILFFYEPYNIPSLRNYLQHLIEFAAGERAALAEQISKLQTSLELLKDKLSLLKSSLQEVKSKLVKSIELDSEKSKEVKPEATETSKSETKTSEEEPKEVKLPASEPTEIPQVEKHESAEPTVPEAAGKPEAAESETIKTEPESSEIPKDATPEKNGKKLTHPTKDRPMGQAGRARPTRKPRSKKSDEESKLLEDLNQKFEEYAQELKTAWILEQRALHDQLDRYTKTYEILKNKKAHNKIKELSLLQQKVGIILGKDEPAQIVHIPLQDLVKEIENIESTKKEKVQNYQKTLKSFAIITTILKDKDRPVDDKKNEIQKQSNYFGPAKLSADDLLKIDVQKFESSVSNLEALLEEF